MAAVLTLSVSLLLLAWLNGGGCLIYQPVYGNGHLVRYNGKFCSVLLATCSCVCKGYVWVR